MRHQYGMSGYAIILDSISSDLDGRFEFEELLAPGVYDVFATYSGNSLKMTIEAVPNSVINADFEFANISNIISKRTNEPGFIIKKNSKGDQFLIKVAFVNNIKGQISIYDLKGLEIFSSNDFLTNQDFVWNGRTNKDIFADNGLYVFVFRGGNLKMTETFLLVR